MKGLNEGGGGGAGGGVVEGPLRGSKKNTNNRKAENACGLIRQRS